MKDIKIGGDISPHYCPNCASPNTVYIEYVTDELDESELGIICEDYDNIVSPEYMRDLYDESD